MSEDLIKVKPYTLKELAAIYEMNYRTFKRHYITPVLEELGQKKGRYYSISQVEFLFKNYKLPRLMHKAEVEE